MAQTLLDILADFTVQLSAPVAIGDTTGNLTSITDDDGNALPNGTYGFTIDGGQSNKEYIVCTLTSTALSDVKSITRQGVSTTGFSKKHRRGAKVSVTDWAILSRMLNLLDGTTGFDSTGTPLGYDGAPASLTGNQFITANWATTVLPLNAAFNTYFEDTGTVNTIVITPSPSIGAYTAGQKFFIKVANTNTGATTINVNGLGAKSLYKQVTVDIGGGAILAGQIILVAYDGTNFQLIGGAGGGSGGGGLVTRSSRGSASLSNGATVLIDTEGTAGANAGNVMTDAGTVQNLYVRTESNSLNGNTVFTLLKNGTPTTVTVTVAASTNTISSDLTHSISVVGGDLLTLQCDTTASASGTASVSFSYQIGSTQATDVQVYAADDMWTKLAGAKVIQSIAVAAGGGGAGGFGGGTGSGAGGGGGQVVISTFNADDIAGSVAVTVGVGGAGGTTQVDGSDGTDSSFGTYVVAKAGTGGVTGNGAGGDGGGIITIAGNGVSGQGCLGTNGTGRNSEYGGASGSGGGSNVGGGSSVYAAAGGGRGASSAGNGSAGGTVGTYTVGGGGAAGTGGGSGTASNGGNGAANSSIGTGYGGQGGGGGGLVTGGGVDTYGNGGNGGFPGGGGGGGAALPSGVASSAGIGGDGADGQVTVITYF